MWLYHLVTHAFVWFPSHHTEVVVCPIMSPSIWACEAGGIGRQCLGKHSHHKKEKSNNTELTVHTGVQKPQYNQQSTYPRLRIHIIYNYTRRCKSKHFCNIIPIEKKKKLSCAFSGSSVGCCINKEKGYLLPTWTRKITCRRFNWMLQSSSGESAILTALWPQYRQ